MKTNLLTKAIPSLATFLLILFLGVFNQKQSTNLKILIWDTPKLSVGTYLAISTGSGFILSYLITANISRLGYSKLTRVTRYTYGEKVSEPIKSNEVINNNYSEYQGDIPSDNQPIDNTYIERDIKDPSPTINANFRVIGRITNENFKIEKENNNYNKKIKSEIKID